MKRIAIFCGSSTGNDPAFVDEASKTGKALADRNIGVVYGGSKIGLMGAVAKAALGAGGEVIGVIPHFLRTKEVAHEGLTKLIACDTMHERKQIMNDLSDAIIALPGGFGTMEEFFEILTWGQLGLHEKPMALLNVNGFYDHLIQLMDHMVKAGLLKPINREMVLVSDNIDELLSMMEAYDPPAVKKWITNETS